MKSGNIPGPEELYDPQPGDAVRFHPTAFVGQTSGFGKELGAEQTGRVVTVNREHGWYRVAYDSPAGTMHESFRIPVRMSEAEKQAYELRKQNRGRGKYRTGETSTR